MAFTCSFRFHDCLNDFLLRKQKGQRFTVDLTMTASVKDTIEAIGVPHVEIGSLTINGLKKPLATLLQPFDDVSVYPFPNRFPAATPLAFVLDVHLGKLARLLRLLGIDAYYENNLGDKEIVTIAVNENRAVLTRDIGLLKLKVLQFGYWLRSQQADEQLLEVVGWFGLCHHIRPFHRCLACNHHLQPATKETVLHLLPPNTASYFSEFFQCTGCQRVYWKGSHFEKMQRWVERIQSIACQ
jgi:hypothetical protein